MYEGHYGMCCVSEKDKKVEEEVVEEEDETPCIKCLKSEQPEWVSINQLYTGDWFISKWCRWCR